MIRVTVNGDAQRFDAPLDVAALLAKLDCKGKKVAVERNGEAFKPQIYHTIRGE